jgi:hypothetical protein
MRRPLFGTYKRQRPMLDVAIMLVLVVDLWLQGKLK